MDRSLEIALLQELHGLKDSGQFFLDDEVHPSPVQRYACADRFDAENTAIFQKLPQIAAHSSELAEPGSYLTMTLAGKPVLLTRDRDGEVNAFLNVCRHRGARLVGEASGCKHAFSCPYHAWTWSNKGELRGIPHEKPGFPGIDRASYGLRRLPAHEAMGFVWVVADPEATPDFDMFLAPLAKEFDWCGTADMAIAHSDTMVRQANWKLLMEGGIEAYHFKVAHRDTIGPHFLDNLSSYQMLGDHMRSVLPRSSLPQIADVPQEQWSIQDHANLLYTVFPTSQFLLMQDHLAWLCFRPLACDRTELRMVTLAPKSEITPENATHWARNHKITEVTLDEDFVINEAVQSGLNSGTNEALTFGRYEGALHKFNAVVEARL